MYQDILIPTYELALLIVTCLLAGFCIGRFVEGWKNMKK